MPCECGYASLFGCHSMDSPRTTFISRQHTQGHRLALHKTVPSPRRPCEMCTFPTVHTIPTSLVVHFLSRPLAESRGWWWIVITHCLVSNYVSTRLADTSKLSQVFTREKEWFWIQWVGSVEQCGSAVSSSAVLQCQAVWVNWISLSVIQKKRKKISVKASSKMKTFLQLCMWSSTLQ